MNAAVGAWLPTFGDVAGHAVLAVRRGWWRMAVLLALVAALSAVVLVLSTPLLRLTTVIAPAATDDASATIAATYSVIFASVLNWLVTAPAIVLGPATAITVAADVLADRDLSLRSEIGRVAGRAVPAFGAFLLLFGGLIASVVVTTPLIYFAFFLIPLGVLLFVLYLAVPRLHRRPVFWVALLLIPFALVTYLTVRWSLTFVAVVADGAGPAEGVQRSWSLTEGRWLEVLVMIGTGALVAALIDLVIVSGIIALAGVTTASPGFAGAFAQGVFLVGSALVAGIPFALLTSYYFQLAGGGPRAARRRAARARTQRG